MSEQMLMDWSLLERMCGDQPDFMRHLVTLYIEDTRRDQSELLVAHARGEREVMERVAHRMCGAAKTVGARRVALCCQTLQGALSRGDEAHSAHELQRIGLELEALFSVLDTRLTALADAR